MRRIAQQFAARNWNFLKVLAEQCRDAGGRAYLVGGCVRSAIMGEQVQDFDVEVFGLPADRLERILGRLSKFARVGRAFGIYKLLGQPIDVGLPRTERKAGKGHRAFEISIDPEMKLVEAARRRDFTMNALYLDVIEEQIEDPLGGMTDLKNRCLRHCSNRFIEDPLRVLRAMQFAARLPATVAPETVALCASLTPEGLSSERFFAEWEKLLLQGKRPSNGLAFLKECHWLQYFPELAALSGCPQDPRWHPEGDVWEHTLHCMDAFAKGHTGDREEDLIVGFAVLCHDMGKPETTEILHDGIRSHGHETAGLKPARQFLSRMNVANRLIEQILPLIKCHMRPAILFQDRSSSSAVRRLARDCGRLDRLIRVYHADSAGRPPLPDNSSEGIAWLRDQARLLKVESNKPARLLNGNDLLQRGWKRGPAMGKFLAEAYEIQLEGQFSTRESALIWLDNQLPGKNASPDIQSADPDE